MILSSLSRLIGTFASQRSVLYHAQQEGLADAWEPIEVKKDSLARVALPEAGEEKEALLQGVRYVYQRLNTPGVLDPRVALRLLQAYAPHMESQEAARFNAKVQRYLLLCCYQSFVPQPVERFAATARHWLSKMSVRYQLKAEDGRRPTPNESIWKEKLLASEQLITLVTNRMKDQKASAAVTDKSEQAMMMLVASQTLTEAAWSSGSISNVGDVMRVIQKKATMIVRYPRAAAQIAVLLIRMAKSFSETAADARMIEHVTALARIRETQAILEDAADAHAAELAAEVPDTLRCPV